MAEDNSGGGIVSDLANAFHGFINGDAFKQGITDAITRHFGGSQPSEHDKAIQQMNDQAQQQRVQDANKSFIKPDVAATIRQKAKGK